MQYDLDDVKIYAFNHTILDDSRWSVEKHLKQGLKKAILIADKVRGDYGL